MLSATSKEKIKFDRRKEAVKYPHTTYIRKLQPGDVFYIPGERDYGCEQVETLPDQSQGDVGITKVKLYGRRNRSTFASWDRCVVVFRFKNPDNHERLV